MIDFDIESEYYPRTDQYEFHFRKYHPTIPGRFVAKPIEWEAVSEGKNAEPCLSFSYGQAQDFMDQLWDLGIRPAKFPKRKRMSKAEIQSFLNDLKELI